MTRLRLGSRSHAAPCRRADIGDGWSAGRGADSSRPPTGASRQGSFAAVLAAGVLVLAACTGGVSRSEVEEIVRAEPAGVEPGLSRAEVEEIVRAEPAGVEQGLSRAEVEEIVSGIVRAALEAEAAPGLSRADVEEIVSGIVRAALEAEAAPGLSRADVEAEVSRSVAESLASALPPGTVLSGEEVRRIARNEVAVIPLRSAPADYTKFFVDSAVSRYEADGLDATAAYYSRPDSVDGQWYVFIADADGELIAHPETRVIGQNLNEAIGTDVNGFEFGTQMLAADEAGRWVPYVYANPATGTLGNDAAFELKNAWVVRHDGLLFGSGWYIDSEEFLPKLIAEAAQHWRRGGLAAILEFYTSPDGISAGFIPTAEYYNATGILGGTFSGFIADPDGVLLAHIDPTLIGTGIEDLLGPAVFDAIPRGTWISADDNPPGTGPESMRIWMMDVDGALIGGGWYSPWPS